MCPETVAYEFDEAALVGIARLLSGPNGCDPRTTAWVVLLMERLSFAGVRHGHGGSKDSQVSSLLPRMKLPKEGDHLDLVEVS